PEQARGQDVDKRADIWAFGVVVYELLTGKMLFDAPTTSDILALVLTKDVDRNAAPAAVRPLLRRCLERDVRKRLRDIGDAPILLEETPVPQAVATPSRLPWAIVAEAAIAMVAAASLAWVHFSEQPPRPSPPLRFEIPAPANASLANVHSVSPDGRYL